jgi:hypothetical protein
MKITKEQLNNIIKEKFGELWRVSYFGAYVTLQFLGEEYFNNKLDAETAANEFKKYRNCGARVDKVEFEEVDIVIKTPNPHKGECL